MFPFNRSGQNCPSMFYWKYRVFISPMAWQSAICQTKDFSSQRNHLHPPHARYSIYRANLHFSFFPPFREKKKSKKQNPRPNKKIWPKSSSHVYNEEDHPLQSEHEHMLLWLHDSSPAGLISVPLPSQLPSQAWPAHRTSPKKKSEGEVQEELFLFWGQRGLSDSTAAKQAQWACRKLPQVAHGLVCPERCRKVCVLLPCREETILILWMPPLLWRRGLLLKCRFIPVCEVARHDYNFYASYVFKYFHIAIVKVSVWRIFFTFPHMYDHLSQMWMC